MDNVTKFVVLTVTFSCILAVPSLRAQWVEDGLPICSLPNEQHNPVIISDGAGGAFITWEDFRDPDHIYAQKIDHHGGIAWTENGNEICTNPADQGRQYTVLDGAGGIIVTWTDTRNGSPLTNADIFAQRLDADGNMLWAADGVAICTAPDPQWVTGITSDGAGGAIITWEDWRNPDSDLFAQRIDPDGNVLWLTDGDAVCSVPGGQHVPQIISDNVGGAIIVWSDDRDGNTDLYAQRIDSNCNLKWALEGVPICTNGSTQCEFHLAPDGEGDGIITWYDDRNGNSDIFAQKIDSLGVVQWTADGTNVCIEATNQEAPRIVSAGDGGAIITWEDHRNGNYDIYAQRLDAIFGIPQWTLDGDPVCTASEHQQYPCIVSDDAGGAIITWRDERSDGGPTDIYNIYIQKIDADGNALWTTDGIVVCAADWGQGNQDITSDGAGGAIIAWEDGRETYVSNFSDIYAHRIDRYGHGAYSFPLILEINDVPDDEGGKITIIWIASHLDYYPQEIITHYSIWRRLSYEETTVLLGQNSTSTVSSAPPSGKEAYRFIPCGAISYAWEWIVDVPSHHFETYAYTAPSLYDSMGTDPHWQHFMVSAQTVEINEYWDSPVDSGYSVDNLTPYPPLGLAGEQSYTPVGIMLTWNPNAEKDLYCYHVYRGTSEGFTPAPGNLVASLCDTFAFDDGWTWDGDYYYKVSAIDVHGNESPFTLLRPDDVTGVETPATPSVSCLGQNYPNPFNPVTTISFGLAEHAYVSLRIYNAAGQLIRVLVNESREPALYEEVWDGTDTGGRASASGVYFYCLAAGPFKQTKKMVLLR